MHRFKKSVGAHWQLYLLLLPTVIYFFIFHYIPMMGVQIAFKDYMAVKGIWGSNWVGFKHFDRFFASYSAQTVILNTILLAAWQLTVSFPIPIVLALMINQHPNRKFQKVIQTITYMPHFISVVVLVGVMVVFCSPTSGAINRLLSMAGHDPIYFFGSAEWFRPLFIFSGIWQSAGWSSIIYLAALSAVSPSLHEAAMIDGASKWQRVLHVDLPSILPTIVVMLILACGQLMTIGFEKVYLMQTPLNLSQSEVILTYVYKVGLQDIQFSYSTAINLFNSLINCVLILTVNALSKRLGETSLW